MKLIGIIDGSHFSAPVEKNAKIYDIVKLVAAVNEFKAIELTHTEGVFRDSEGVEKGAYWVV